MTEERTDRREQAAVLAVEAFQGPWHLAADLIEAAGGAHALLEGSRDRLEEGRPGALLTPGRKVADHFY